MAQLIHLRDGNYVAPSQVVQVQVIGSTVAVNIGNDPMNSKRDQFHCSSEADALALAERIVADINADPGVDTNQMAALRALVLELKSLATAKALPDMATNTPVAPPKGEEKPQGDGKSGK